MYQGHILKVKVTKLKSLKVKSRSQNDVTHLHAHPMALPSINTLHLTFSEIQPMASKDISTATCLTTHG